MSGRNAALDHARTALTVLVVIHHAVIAYTYYGHIDPQSFLGFDGMVLANDSFFMALFFFLSGLFVWPSLQRKTTLNFLRDRLLRLGLPFALVALTLMPLAYYALELRQPHHLSFWAFWHRTVTTGPWPSGPVWFVWVLLSFDLITAAIHRVLPNGLAPLNRLFLLAHDRPATFFAIFFCVTGFAYTVLRFYFGVNRWFEFGPFSVQASRVLYYASYFAFGAIIGSANVEQGLLAKDGQLARRWWVWALAALASYSIIVALVYYRRAILPDPNDLPEHWIMAYGYAFPLFSAAMAFAVLAYFIRFDGRGTGVLDAMQPAAYGIFLIHYLPVLWVQYWMRNMDWSAGVKAGIAFVFALGVSWLATIALRRIPNATRVL